MLTECLLERERCLMSGGKAKIQATSNRPPGLCSNLFIVIKRIFLIRSASYRVKYIPSVSLPL